MFADDPKLDSHWKRPKYFSRRTLNTKEITAAVYVGVELTFTLSGCIEIHSQREHNLVVCDTHFFKFSVFH